MEQVTIGEIDRRHIDLGSQVADRRLGVDTLLRIDQTDGASNRLRVPGHRAKQMVCSRNLLCFDDGGRRKNTIPVNHLQPRTVRPDRPQALDRQRRLVHIFPAGIEDASIGQDAGREIVQHIGGQADNVRAVGLHAMKHTDRAGIAVHPLIAASRDERDTAVGQAARIEVEIRAGRHLP